MLRNLIRELCVLLYLHSNFYNSGSLEFVCKDLNPYITQCLKVSNINLSIKERRSTSMFTFP